MRVLLVADMRSPHSIGWADGLTNLGIETVIVSSRRLTPAQRLALPEHVRGLIALEASDPLSRLRAFITRRRGLLNSARLLARDRAPRPGGPAEGRPEGTGLLEFPLEMLIARILGRRVGALAERVRPDLIHALRIPFEGVAVSPLASRWPIAVSIWGQDLARQASASRGLAAVTRRCLARARGVHADCQRDLDLAELWGARPTSEQLVAAGNMGYDPRVFNPGDASHAGRTVVTCPRGPAPQVNYAGFLRVAARIADRFPGVEFVGVALAGNPLAESIRANAAHPARIVLTEYLTATELADLYRHCLAVVSPSSSDGTPISVVTGMACGAIPLVGDIAPLRELIGDRLPNTYFDPMNDDAMERSLVSTLELSRDDWTTASRTAHDIATTGWSQAATQGRVREWYEAVQRSRA